MIRFLEHDSIDKQKWDECIEHAINSRVYATSWYLDIVSPGWCALIEDNYSKVFPLPVKKKYGINYIIQPYFTQQLGLFSLSPFSSAEADEFLIKIPRKFKFVDVFLNSGNKSVAWQHTTPAPNLILNLNENYLHIYASYKTNLQRNLSRASSNKLTIFEHCRPEELIQLFKENRGTKLKHLTDKEYELIKRIAYLTLHNGAGEIWGIHDQHNQLCAGVLWVKHKNRFIFLFSAVSQSGKQSGAMPYLIDSYLQKHAGEDAFIDFEGSKDEGLARFYSSFGSVEETYFRYTDYRMHWIINKLAKWIKE